MTTDCFEPIFGFLGQFCFEKHRSASWSRIGMFSELSGCSVIVIKPKAMKIDKGREGIKNSGKWADIVYGWPLSMHLDRGPIIPRGQ